MFDDNICVSIFSLITLILMSRSGCIGALNPNWKSFIAPDILKQYAGIDQRDRFSPDVFEGDIMGVTIDDALQDIAGQFKPVDVFNDKTARWKSGVIPYNVSEKFSKAERELIEGTLKATSVATDGCIRFVPWTLQADYLSIIRGFACFSSVGFQGGLQLLSLRNGCVENSGVIQHVLMHALGFYHENARVDRDDFITLNEDNIDPAVSKDSFGKYVSSKQDELPYDITSITHYPFNVFAVDPALPTIVPKLRGGKIGQTDGLSDLDVHKIRKAYGCTGKSTSSKWTSTPSSQQPDTIDTTMADSNDGDLLKNITPDLPDNIPITTPTAAVAAMFHHPTFLMNRVTPEKCLGVNTENCRIGKESKNCADGLGLIATCTADASNIEIQYFFTKIQRLNASRGLEVTIHGKREFKQNIFEPVADILIILIVADYPDFSLSALANWSCRPSPTSACQTASTVKEIEQGAFESLQFLKQVTLDTGYRADRPMTKAMLEHLRLLHCDCSYDWLRVFLKKNPQLIAAKRVGEVHRFGGILSNSFKQRNIYVPVDCSKTNLLGAPDQTEFSINLDCPGEENGGAAEG
ncbi:putative Zinc metalloproteinase nas-7 [Hypsibius exemplaris]|uniref:Metalloendopeptidase n=1 Tax=Hypsibius exemplaris TaxID=2072580 RepID=A0A9X6NAW6_HYPEX|nr:putative Zinc metalloproteinase nas-7 [Hypsibius exemplaris]